MSIPLERTSLCGFSVDHRLCSTCFCKVSRHRVRLHFSTQLRGEDPVMATFVDPLAGAAEAYEKLRGLAHTTRTFVDPADTYRVLGEMSGSV